MSDDNTVLTAKPRRAGALDALRGLAILLMVLCSSIPFGVLPAWMYHAQTPPPSHAFIPLPGLTWVDLVFPFFLFAMGAALPLALGRKAREKPAAVMVWQIMLRGAVLAAFGIYTQHIRPFIINPGSKTAGEWLIALAGFLLLFPALSRLPAKWNSRYKFAIRVAAVALMAALLYGVKYPDTGGGFSVYRSDIIIMFLSAMAVWGSAVYLLTRESVNLRLGFMAALFAVKLSWGVSGWVRTAVPAFPLPWLFDWTCLRYLFAVIPGTIAGDLIAAWMRSGDENAADWKGIPAGAFAILMPLLVVLTLIGLQTRHGGYTAAAGAAVCALAFALIRTKGGGTRGLIYDFFRWGVFWYFLGLLMEPFEGGIKKDPPTMSYYFTTCGLALFTLAAFMIISSVFKKRWFKILEYNGQNPMIAYMAGANLVAPLLALTGLGAALSAFTAAPWAGFCLGVVETGLAALAVAWCTRRGIFWRA